MVLLFMRWIGFPFRVILGLAFSTSIVIGYFVMLVITPSTLKWIQCAAMFSDLWYWVINP